MTSFRELVLRNTDQKVILAENIYQALLNDPNLIPLDFFNHLRVHSYGYAFFQRNFLQPDGNYKNITIYLHKYIAECFMSAPPEDGRYLVTFKNGNRLDCRLENLMWATSSQIVRNTRSVNSYTSYRGVSRVNGKFRAIIFKDRVRYDLGMFNTAEEAAQAYNAKSSEWFGETRSLNKISVNTHNK